MFHTGQVAHYRPRPACDICSENTRELQALTELIESGQVRPVINRTYPLSQVPEAIQYLRDGYARGKVVVSL